MTTWERHGECNNCGHCCQTLSRQFVVRQPIDPYWDEFYRTRGFTSAPGGVVGRFAWLTAPCPQHVGGQCAVEATKPQRCRDFPTMPTEIVGTPCSYWFESNGVRVGGDGSAHPCSERDLIQIEAQLALELTS